MPLDAAPVGPVIPTSDLARSRAFYEGALGLRGSQTSGGHVVRAGDETAIYLLEAPESAGTANWPIASFRVVDIAAHVAELKDRGVAFLTDADVPFDLDTDDISRQDGMSVAWMRDPDDQILTLFELG